MDKLEFYHELYEERAAIMEHDGNWKKDHAQILAFRAIIKKFAHDEDLDRGDQKVMKFSEELRNRIQNYINLLKVEND